MSHATPGAPSERPTLVVADGLAARQWELTLAAAEIARGASAWTTPNVEPYSSWLGNLWLAGSETRGTPLTSRQSRALWRRVIAESTEANELIGQAGVAEWAAGAWELLHRWSIDPRSERAGAEQIDYRALLGWCRAYREQLDAHGWIDRAELESKLAAAPPRGIAPTILTDLAETHPARETLLAALTAAGCSVAHESAPPVEGRRHAARLADAVDELRAALTWARGIALRTPAARVAVVVAGLTERQGEVDRLLAATFGADDDVPVWNAGHALGADATVGAAFNALTLLSPATGYAAFGRWLCSRVFGASAAELAARARLDARLRMELRAQLPFATAYRQCGLAATLEQRAPDSAAQLRAAFAAVGDRPRATPGGWAQLWTNYLRELRWSPPAGPTLRAWQASLDELASLTPILGEMSIGAALAELERILANAAPVPLPVRGVHLLGRIEQVGPGYGAAWVTGFTDAYWPEAPQGNPLLPRALQRARGMPRATPQDARDRSARSLQRLCARVPDLIVSWPARVYDYETEPSPAIRDWPLANPDLAGAPAGARDASRRERSTVDDPAPPVRRTELPGGAGMLNRQARHPLLAFCRDRLRARPLEPLAFGLSSRLRGIVVHRALEELLRGLPTQAAIAATDAATLSRAAEHALTSVFVSAQRPMRALYEIELEQLRALIAGWLEGERARAPFTVLAVEQGRSLQLGPFTLSVRIDRLDRLGDGSVAVIDYKTGERATSADWFAPRLRDAQVPLYAIDTREPLGAAVVARVRPAGTSFSGVWPEGAFAARSTRLPGDWPAQLVEWRTQIMQLVGEFAAGDVRVFADDYDDLGGANAPLTRIAEQLAIARGAAKPWSTP
jgi:ATP-dependent helicase/nuclease subunit B